MSRFPRWWFWAAVLVPALVTLVGLALQGPGIERTVEAEARKAATQGRLVVNGRDVTISGVPVEQADKVDREVEAATGVRDVSIVDSQLAPMRISFTSNEITITGSTEQRAWRDQFVRAQTEASTEIDDTEETADTELEEPDEVEDDEPVVIKASKKSMRYHTPDSPYYNRVSASLTFISREEAELAGYKPWNADKVKEPTA